MASDSLLPTMVALAGVCLVVLAAVLHARRADRANDAFRVALERAQRGEQRLRDLIDGLGPSLFVGLMTPDGILVEANRSGLVAAGVALQDVLGQPFDETPWWRHSPEAQEQLREAMARGARGEPSRYDVQVRGAGGEVVDIDFSLQVVRDDAGAVAYLVPSASVTSARERAVAALRRSQREQRRLVEELETESARLLAAQTVAKVGSWETDLESGEVSWSAETYRIFGISPSAFEGTHAAFLECVHPEDRAEVDAAFRLSLEQPGEHTIEHRLVLPDGRIRFVEERWRATFDDRGRALRAIGTCQDNTARRQAGEALDRLTGRMEQRERMLTMTLTYLGDFAYTYGRDGRFLFVNQPLLDLWEITLEEAVGKNFADLGYPPELAAKLQGEVQQVIDTSLNVTGETPFTSPAGVTGVYEYIFSPVIGEGGAVEFVVGSSRNITERKHAVEALRTSLEEFRALAEAIPQMLWVAGPDGSSVYCNQQWIEYTGLTLGESLGQEWTIACSPDDRDRIAGAWRRALATGGTFAQECRLRRSDGEHRWSLVRSAPVRDDAGDVLKWFGTCTDVHDLKVAEQERADAEGRLLRSAQEYRVLFDGNPHPMWVFDSETLAFLAVNDAAVRLYGFSRDEFLGMTIKDIRPEEEVPSLLQYLATIPNTPGLVATQTRHRRKDGSPLEIAGASNPIEFQGRHARLVMAQDTTEKK